MTLDGGDTVHDGVDVQKLAGGYVCGLGSSSVLDVEDRRFICLAVVGLLLALYEAEKIGLCTAEIGMFKVPWFGVRVALQDALLQVRNFVKPVHVQLAHERREFLVFKPTTEYFTSKPLMVEDC